jgi:hypothetical protein
MRLKWVALVGIAALSLTLSLPSAAHHGQAGLFDEARTIELKGAVKQWSFVNPHPILLLEVTDEKGVKAEWDVYFGPSGMSFMRRNGYTPETFKVGETVIVKGHPATGAGVRGVDIWGKGVSVTRADGTALP